MAKRRMRGATGGPMTVERPLPEEHDRAAQWLAAVGERQEQRKVKRRESWQAGGYSSRKAQEKARKQRKRDRAKAARVMKAERREEST